MSLLHIDTQIDLFRPSQAEDKTACAVYCSELRLNGSVFPVTVAHPLQEAESQPLPAGTNAYLFGSFSVVDDSILVTASELLPLYVATTPATRAAARELYEPYITVAGVVSPGRVLDIIYPAALVVDVTASCNDRWPCFFNRDEKRFRTLTAFLPNTPLILSGKPFGWADGKLAVDVHEVRFNNLGDPPAPALALYPSPFQHCQLRNGYGVFPDKPPAYSPRSLSAVREDMIIEVSDSEDDGSFDCAAAKVVSQGASRAADPSAAMSRRTQLPEHYFLTRTPAAVGNLPRINIQLMRRRVYVMSWVQHAVRSVRCVHEVLTRLHIMQSIYEGIGGMMLQDLGRKEMGDRKRRALWAKINTWFADHIVFFETAISMCYGDCDNCVERA
ncbi:hypothetical protein AURDEDRAFT_176440 [Auricularia subglabra TFB-10046 SS5]|uniref:Uncharacterized protein n=1 Tax=Auricularia subglabra (strain TFB-10046 / SS5) TaxID=717982 RepID=J0WPZ5_AURST|nr:hypothetical protein AURDEDRAFT_176440 [Auricularia subglabra TFB-10046 SS5]